MTTYVHYLTVPDMSVGRARRVLEDVLVIVNNAILPADFVVLDTKTGLMPSRLPIILARPFMRTADMKICNKIGTISIKVNREKLEFKMFEVMKKPLDDESKCFAIDLIDDMSDEVFQGFVDDALGNIISQGWTQETLETCGMMKDIELMAAVLALTLTPLIVGKANYIYEKLDTFNRILFLSRKNPLVMELKQLPSNLRYAYLRENETIPITVAASLSGGG